MINKSFKRLFFTLVLFVFFMQSIIVHAEIKDNQIVESTKVWTIKFNKEVVLDEVNRKNIIVKDSNGNIVTGLLTLGGQANESILVNPPSGGYIAGEKYVLNIGKDIHSKNEKKMKADKTMNFSIKDATNIFDNTERGNTAGNIVNGGGFAEKDGWIYYSPNNTLCKMKSDGSDNMTLSNDTAFYINVIGNYIYYINWGAGGGNYKNVIYRMNVDGTNRIMLSNDFSSNLNVVGNYVYYVDKSDAYGDGNICRINIDGTKKVKLTIDQAEDIVIKDGWIYYANVTDAYKLYKVKIDGTNNTKLTDDTTDCINLSNSYIYYIGKNKDDYYKDGTLFRIKLDGTEKKQLTINNIRNINVADKCIYFTVNTDGNTNLYKMNEDILQPILLLSDKEYQWYSINIIDEYIYFTDWPGIYKVKNDGTGIARGEYVQNQNYKLDLVIGSRVGNYTGYVTMNNIPNGQGSFTSD